MCNQLTDLRIIEVKGAYKRSYKNFAGKLTNL